jgi:hypothetical protein
MVYPGTKGKILPPTITGIGFMIIAITFLGLRNKKTDVHKGELSPSV